LLIEGAKANVDGLCVPAVDPERIVTARLLSFLRNRSEVFAAIRSLAVDGNARRQMLERASRIEARWTDSAASERRVLLRRLLSRILVQADTVTLHLSPARLAALLANTSEQQSPVYQADGDPILLSTPARLMRSKQEMRMIVRSGTEAAGPDPTLIRLIFKAQLLRDKLMQGNLQLGELAARQGLSSSCFTRLMRNAFLAPDITAAILDGRQPADLTTFKLMAGRRLPLDWAEQRRVLGFS
jgi:site-specific DNA recombinase